MIAPSAKSPIGVMDALWIQDRAASSPQAPLSLVLLRDFAARNRIVCAAGLAVGKAAHRPQRAQYVHCASLDGKRKRVFRQAWTRRGNDLHSQREFGHAVTVGW